MPQAVSVAAAVGFYGKIPARGDFVRAGLPRAFTDPWDCWMQRVLAMSRAALAEEWLPAWLEAPVWRFALAPGVCGHDAAIGLWMPSVDRIGRYYPLTIAAVAPEAESCPLLREADGFLAAAEWAGREAVEEGSSPDELGTRLTAAIAAPAAEPPELPACPAGGGLWWTDGGPRVPAGSFATAKLPDDIAFIAMLSAHRR